MLGCRTRGCWGVEPGGTRRSRSFVFCSASRYLRSQSQVDNKEAYGSITFLLIQPRIPFISVKFHFNEYLSKGCSELTQHTEYHTVQRVSSSRTADVCLTLFLPVVDQQGRYHFSNGSIATRLRRDGSKTNLPISSNQAVTVMWVFAAYINGKIFNVKLYANLARPTTNITFSVSPITLSFHSFIHFRTCSRLRGEEAGSNFKGSKYFTVSSKVWSLWLVAHQRFHVKWRQTASRAWLILLRAMRFEAAPEEGKPRVPGRKFARFLRFFNELCFFTKAFF